jgi:hypothetical protein
VRYRFGRCALGTVALVALWTLSAFGPEDRISIPIPTPEALVVTVGPEGCVFRTIHEALAAVPPGSVLELAGGVFTEGGAVLEKDLFLRGSAADPTIVQASESIDTSTERVFTVAGGATVVLSNLTLRHGNPQGDCPRGGGAIINYGTLWMERCVLSDNVGQCGGGLLNRDGTVYAFDCMILRNRAPGGKDMTGAQSMGSGGGIKNAVGEMVLERCTIAYNTARKKGGAVKNCCLATLTMRNCTVVGNDCKSGGLHLNGPAFIDHCTIAYNTAPLSYGAGVYVDSASVIRNSIIAGNTLGDVTVEVASDGADARFENVWIGDGRAEFGAWSGDPMLGSLQDNGGFTWTCFLLPGSPAIDVGILHEDSPSLDQCGGARVRGAAPDLGAVEMAAEN